MIGYSSLLPSVVAVTRNTNDFKNIAGLKTIKLYAL